MNVLLIHGNGGANARFDLFKKIHEADPDSGFKLFFPELPGFEGRPLGRADRGWHIFIEALQKLISNEKEEQWILYGHGIGGSILLEWANIAFQLSQGEDWSPKAVILHAPVGASLSKRWFPKLMKPRAIRSFLHFLIYQKALQPTWERRLFLYPDQIPQAVRDQFFKDYKRCEAFPLFFDLITPEWYKEINEFVHTYPFCFIWGEKERVIASKFVEYWKSDFPNAEFEIVENWDHFPMLDTPDDYYQFMKNMFEAIKAKV